MIKAPVNKLLVTIDKKYQDKSGELFIDNTYQPEEYATLKGIVYSIPDRVDNEAYRDVEELVKVGDEVWFSYSIIYDYLIRREGETPVYRNLIAYQGEEYWKVDYGEIFCIVRNEEILMPNQCVLLAPIKDSEEEFIGGLFSIKKSENFEDRAEVVAVPKMNISCKPGDIIPVEPGYVQKYTLFDKPHFILPVRRLVAKY